MKVLSEKAVSTIFQHISELDKEFISLEFSEVPMERFACQLEQELGNV